MKIELRKVSFSERMSEETNAFTADLYVDGKKVGYCKNTGQGGCTNYHWNTVEDRETILEAERYCKTLPTVTMFGEEFQQSLEDVIDNLFEDWMKAKDAKKIEKQMSDSILFGVPKADSYSRLKLGRPLSTMNKQTVCNEVNRMYAKYCKDGVVILNTNLEALGIEFRHALYAVK